MSFVVQPGPLLRERSTLRLGGRALAEVLVLGTSGLERLPETLAALGGQPYALGRGSNILARDGELPVVLVRMRQEPRPEPLATDATGTLVRVPAGMSLQRLLHWLAARGLAGLEGLAGVPGDVGGAVAMNAGSFGCTMGDCLERVQVLDSRGLRWCGAGELETGYRHFALPGQAEFFVVTAAELRLRHLPPQEVKARMAEHLATKRRTQPLRDWTAGCAFRNPAPEAPAGLLLERAGLKGLELGGMKFSERHANFLVNTGSGSATAAYELLALAQERVQAQSGYALELEVKPCPR